MIRLSEQNGGVFQNVDEIIEKARAASDGLRTGRW